ncbi:MAG: FAD-binding oxidoreductase [Candidatus Woesearchaeota archaeon]
MKSNYNFGNLYDASKNFGTSLEVYYVENIDEIKTVINSCKKRKNPITVRASGTSLTGSSVPNYSVVINVSKMHKILEITEDYVIVEPGVILDDLNYELKKRKKMFPVIPSSHGIATIGGMISCNAAGKESIAFGKTLDWVDSLWILGSDCEEYEIKEIPQYTEGTLGVIIKAKLKITDLVEESSFDIFEFENYESLIKFSEELKKTKHSSLLSVEGIGFFAARMLGFNKNLILISYKDDSGKYKQKPEIFEKRDSLYSLLSQNGYSIVEDPQMDLRKLLPFLDELQIPWFGHLGVNLIHPCFKNLEDAIKLMEFVKKEKGIISGEHGYGLLKKKYRPKNEKQKIINLKLKFDPYNLFNPHLLQDE